LHNELINKPHKLINIHEPQSQMNIHVYVH